MTSDTASSPGVFPSSFGALEPNVLLAALEGIAAGVLWEYVVRGRWLLQIGHVDWHWSYGLYAVLALPGLYLLGLCVEGVASLVEMLLTRNRRGTLRNWYRRAINPPTDFSAGQFWIWTSSLASREFARRRLRIVVARNSWVIIAALTISIIAGLARYRSSSWVSTSIQCLVFGVIGFGLFFWVWLAAQEAWNSTVRAANEQGGPRAPAA